MTTPSRRELREWSAALTLGPLDPADPRETRYVPLAEAGRAAVDELLATVELAVDTTTQLLSGPSGSGKTTELYRLKGELERSGFHATIFDIGKYVNESSPIDVTEFLIALALGAQYVLGLPEAVDERAGFANRLRGLLARLKISVEVPGLSASVSREGLEVGAMGTSVEVELQRELKSSESVVAELRRKLTYHIGHLYEEVATFLTTLLPVNDPRQGSVLIVDGLEKLRGTSENDFAVQESVQTLFIAHASKLQFSSHHVIYTVPTYLQFTAPGALPYDSRVLPVPVPHVRPRLGESADSVAETVAELREVVSRRLPIERIFAHTKQLDQIIDASGGHLRDLFTLLRQVVNLMLRMSLTLPLRDEHVEEAISLVAHDFLAMTAEQEAFLRRVTDGDGTVRPATSEVQLMARLLQSHMLLGHLNGQDWYEVHPLAMRALGLP